MEPYCQQVSENGRQPPRSGEIELRKSFHGVWRMILSDLLCMSQKTFLTQMPHNNDALACWQNAFDTSAVPATAEDLRHMLYSISLRDWLPNLLCSSPSAPSAPPPPPPSGEEDGTTTPAGGEGNGDVHFSPPSLLRPPPSSQEVGLRRQCFEVVDAALSATVGAVEANQMALDANVHTSWVMLPVGLR